MFNDEDPILPVSVNGRPIMSPEIQTLLFRDFKYEFNCLVATISKGIAIL